MNPAVVKFRFSEVNITAAKDGIHKEND